MKKILAILLVLVAGCGPYTYYGYGDMCYAGPWEGCVGYDDVCYVCPPNMYCSAYWYSNCGPPGYYGGNSCCWYY